MPLTTLASATSERFARITALDAVRIALAACVDGAAGKANAACRDSAVRTAIPGASAARKSLSQEPTLTEVMCL